MLNCGCSTICTGILEGIVQIRGRLLVMHSENSKHSAPVAKIDDGDGDDGGSAIYDSMECGSNGK